MNDLSTRTQPVKLPLEGSLRIALLFREQINL